MRNILFVIFSIYAQCCLGQHREVSFQVNSGLFSFGGASASSTSFINISDVATISDYTNNPYGTNSAFSYGLGVKVQFITPKNLVYGLGLSYESLSSKLRINEAYGEGTWNIDEGKTIFSSDFINLFPAVGRRVKIFDRFDTDFLVGADFGIGLASKEHYSLTTNQGNEISGTNKRELPTLDFRPRIEIISYYKRFGLSIGYSYGLTNYEGDLDGGNREAKSRYLRFGLNYRLL